MGRPQVRVSLRWSIRVRFCLCLLLRRRRQDSSPIVGVHQRPGEQVSGTVVFAILHGRRRIRFLWSALRATAPKRLLHLLLGGLLYDYFLAVIRGTTLVHLPASTLYDYINWGPPTISMANPEDNGASVASGNRPAFGYTLILLWFYLFIMINLLYLFSIRIVLTLVALICDMSFLHMLNLVVQFVMIYILVLIW
jgi:hypothetical protein